MNKNIKILSGAWRYEIDPNYEGHHVCIVVKASIGLDEYWIGVDTINELDNNEIGAICFINCKLIKNRLPWKDLNINDNWIIPLILKYTAIPDKWNTGWTACGKIPLEEFNKYL